MKKNPYEDSSVFCSLEKVTNEDCRLVLGHIGRFCFLCYNLNVNPLSALRTHYPMYEWKLIDCEHGFGDLLDQISHVDFVWAVGPLDYVVATHKSKPLQGIIRAFWSDEYTTGHHGRTVPDLIQQIGEVGFKVYGILESE